MSKNKINIAKFLDYSLTNGPGLRSVIWVQGCKKSCRGCFNPEYQPLIEKELVDVDELFQQIITIPGIEGVTFSGGEPFLQVASLRKFASMLQEAGFSIVTYSGYTLEELREAKRDDYDSLLNVTDILIDGHFILERATDSLIWRGSDNQRLHFLSPRYKNIEKKLDIKNNLEIRIDSCEEIHLSGFPDPDFMNELARMLQRKGIETV